MLKGIRYTQVGKQFEFETKSTFFRKEFKSGGKKQDYVTRQDKARWRKTVPHIMTYLESIQAHHIISYMDAIYINRVSTFEKVQAIDVKTEKKHNSDLVNSVFNKYL